MKVPRFLLLLTCATVFAVGAGLVRADGGPKPTMTAPAPSARTFLVTPKTKPDGGKWRIGYYESSNYKLYPQTLLEIARGLQHMGWMDEKPDVPDDLSGEDLWRWLARHARSDTLEFVEDAYWQSSDTGGENEPRRLAARESFRKRVETRGDLALVIAMGTAAGQDMVKLGAPIPVIVAQTSDPLRSGIVKSARDSGLDNLYAQINPDRYQHQIRLFHEVVRFGRLGVVYENSPEGRTYAGMDALKQVAGERGFDILTCVAPVDVPEEVMVEELIACYQNIAPKVNAVYISESFASFPFLVEKIATILRKAQVPSFSMQGASEVQSGIMMSLTPSSQKYIGLFYAETMARIFNGAKPRQIDQIWNEPNQVTLNLETIRQIGFDPPLELLLAAEEVYGIEALRE